MVIGRYKHGKYIMLHLDDGRRILEHRFVMGQYLGREITNDEVVHHLDHNGSNNLITNLELMDTPKHNHFHGGEYHINHTTELICPQCGQSFRKRNGKIRYAQEHNKRIFCSRHCSGVFNSSGYWSKIIPLRLTVGPRALTSEMVVQVHRG